MAISQQESADVQDLLIGFQQQEETYGRGREIAAPAGMKNNREAGEWQFSSKLSSVRMGSDKFSKRHFNGYEDEEVQEGTVSDEKDNYENNAGNNSGTFSAFDGGESSNNRQRVKTEHSVDDESDLAYFPISQKSELVQPRTQPKTEKVYATPSREIAYTQQMDQMNTTFARVQDQLDEDGIKSCFLQNDFEAGFSQVRRLFSERTNALHESANLRHKLLQLEGNDQVLKNDNKKLRGVVTQQTSIIRKLKAQRQELLTFYKKHKKYELREAQIEN